MKNFERYTKLWDSESEYTDEDIKFLKNHIKSKKFKVSYGFYNRESQQKKQIAVIFDVMPSLMKRTGSENNWDIVQTRDITDLEIEEFINHYLRNSFKRFLVFYYKNVDRLIYDDNRLGVKTPEIFIEQCRKKGYSGTFQLKLEYT